MAYMIEGLLFAFHLRGDLLDVEIHTLLVLTIFLTAVVILAEIQHKSNVLLSSLRPILVIMQGVWFVQAAFILFRGKLTDAVCRQQYPCALHAGVLALYHIERSTTCSAAWNHVLDCTQLTSMKTAEFVPGLHVLHD